MELQVKNAQNGYPEMVLCPGCGSDYTHHGQVEIFEHREGEVGGLHVSVENGSAMVDRDLGGNPSERRHGVRIHFGCENCSSHWSLTIAQHKGQSHIENAIHEPNAKVQE